MYVGLMCVYVRGTAVVCLSDFEGGGWVLVRRTPGTLAWHQATDNLAGTDVYGTYGSDTSDSMFSIAWNTWDFTEMLFASGMCVASLSR
jgi:hypothetical protein